MIPIGKAYDNGKAAAAVVVLVDSVVVICSQVSSQESAIQELKSKSQTRVPISAREEHSEHE